MSSASVGFHTQQNLEKVFDQVKSWGSGDSGQLGHGFLRDSLSPLSVEDLGDESIVGISAGTSHSLALTDHGAIYSWGFGGSGQLGHPKRVDSTGTCVTPRAVFAMKDVAVSRVCCGYAHSAALTVSGDVYTWGDGYWGQLGHGVEQDESIPASIGALSKSKATHISCGWSHTAILTSDGKLYICGRASWGDIGGMGRCNEEARFNPREIDGLSHEFVKYVDCGGLHTVAITKSEKVYLLGFQVESLTQSESDPSNENITPPNQSEDSQNLNNPVQIEIEHLSGLDGKGAYLCACGGHHSLVLTENGDVYSFGKGEFGQLGLGAGISSSEPKLIEPLSGLGVTSIACGAYHSAAITEDGCLYVWGGGWYGQLGIGKIQLQSIPITPPDLLYEDVRAVSCGFYHTLAITTHYLTLLCNGLQNRLEGETEKETEINKRLLYYYLISGGERFLRRVHNRAYQKLCDEQEEESESFFTSIFSPFKKSAPLPLTLDVSHHILTFGVADDEIFPIAKKSSEIITLVNRNSSPVRFNLLFGDSYDSLALNSDFDLSVQPSHSAVIEPGAKYDLKVILEVNIETCNDIILFLQIEGGIGAFFVVKVRTSAAAQKIVSKQLQTANKFEASSETSVTLNEEMRNEFANLMLMKEDK